MSARVAAQVDHCTQERCWLRALDTLERQQQPAHPEPGVAWQRPMPLPPWAAECDEILAAERSADGTASGDRIGDEQGLGAVVAPFVTWAERGLESALRRHIDSQVAGSRVDTDTIVSSLRPALTARLVRQASRTLVLEMHVARLRSLLPGDTPDERFQQFVRRATQRDVRRRLFCEYPVLARALHTASSQWVQSAAEWLGRLASDWPLIRPLIGLGPDEPLHLSSVKAGAGDLHRDGRSVVIATFADMRRVVYKPRSLAVDRHYGALVGWINAELGEELFRASRLIDRGDYGWTEYHEPAACATREEVRRFFKRQGAHLALFFLLDCTDMHFENIIACGEFPICVDLESMFHPFFDVGDEPVAVRTAKLSYRSRRGDVMSPGPPSAISMTCRRNRSADDERQPDGDV